MHIHLYTLCFQADHGICFMHVSFLSPTRSFNFGEKVNSFNMPIVLFSHQVADVRGQLRLIHQSKKSTVLVDSFLERAFAALRHDVRTLPREARSQFVAFNSVFDLSERHHNAKT